MNGRIRMLIWLLGIAAVLVAMRVVGTPLAVDHVERVTGRSEVGAFQCWDCHFAGGSGARPSGLRHPDPWHLATSPTGGELAFTAGPVEKVGLFDPGAGTVRLSATLGGRPRGLAYSPDGRSLAVSLAAADEVVLLDPSELTVERRLPVGMTPAGVAWGVDGALFVANADAGTVSVWDPSLQEITARVDGGREPFAVTASADGERVAVVSRMVSRIRPHEVPYSEVVFLDGRRGFVERRVRLASCHLAEDAEFTRDGRYLLVPALRVRNLLPILQVARGWVVSGVLAVVEVATGEVRFVPLGDPTRPFADPSAVAVDEDDRWLWVAAGGGDEVARIDLEALLAYVAELRASSPERLSDSRRYVVARYPVGDNPRGLEGFGDEVVVAERLRDSLAVLAPSGEIRRTPVGAPVPVDQVRRGDAVFHDASYAFQGAFSCRSCHPGGHTDGLTYDFDIDGVGRNVVLNRSLRGVRGTEPFKWVGLNPTLARQCGARFAMVLTRADVFPEESLEALVAYIESLPAPPPRPGAGRLSGADSGAVERGRLLFERSRRKDGEPIATEDLCDTCHRGPHFTNRQLADVGTGTPYDKSGEFDVPHLTGVGSKAPYLHDGRATTLEEIWTLPGVGDQHGVMSDLNKSDLNDLVEYLKSL